MIIEYTKNSQSLDTFSFFIKTYYFECVDLPENDLLALKIIFPVMLNECQEINPPTTLIETIIV